MSPLGGQALDLAPHVGPRLGVEAGGRLVQEQHRGAVDEAQGDVELALHAARVGACDAPRRLSETETLEQLVDARFEGAAGHVVEAALEQQVLAPAGVHVDGRALRDAADRPAHAVRLAQHVEPATAACPGRAVRGS